MTIRHMVTIHYCPNINWLCVMACGIVEDDSVDMELASTDWEEVTCKKCLEEK